MAKKPQDLKQINKTFISSMKKVAKALGILPSDITQVQFYANDPNDLAEWDIRKAGGYMALKNTYFPRENNEEVLQGSRMLQNFRNKLNKKYGQDDYFLSELRASVKEIMHSAPIKMHPIVEPAKSAKKKPHKRTIVAHLSDTHYGTNISASEMNGLNEFSWEIAARRTACFIDQICSYKPQYRDETDLILCINGDIIGGQIHNQEWFVDLLTTQFAGTLSILSQAVSYAAQKFSKVTVVATTGNHGRNVGKADKGRATTHKWDSYEHMIYVSLANMFTANKNVTFVIPEAPFAIFDAQGHKFFQTHGDTVVNVGNPGTALNMSGINNQINKINASMVDKGGKIAGLIVGHVHVPTVQLTESGCMLLINGCLSGTDPYAQSIGIMQSNPTQCLFEVTPEHAVGDIRLIQVKGADKNKAMDKIIAPFKGKF